MALQTKDFSVTAKSSGGGITYTFILRVTENSVNTAANTSNLTVQAILKQSYSGTAFYSWGTGVLCSLNGTQIFSDYQKRRLDGTAEAAYYTWTGDVAHNADGTLTLSVSGKLWQNSATTFTPPTMTVSGTMTLTAIARESTVGASAANIGGNTTISVNRKNSAYTHSIAYSFGALSGYIGADWAHSDTEVKLTDTSIAFTVPESFYAQIPNSKTGVCTLTVRTYSGDTQIGSAKTCTFTVTAANCAPEVTGTVVDINEKTLALTGNEKVLVKFFSTAQCTITAAAKHSASISKMYIGGTQVTENVRTIENVETADIAFRAEDSRGYFATDTDEEITLLEYIRLTNNATVTRDDPTSGNATVKLSGSYYDGAFSENIPNSLTVQYRVNGGEWVTAQPDLSFVDGRYSGTLALTGLEYTASHTVQITVSDALDSVTKTLTVNKGIPVFDWGENDFRFHVPVDMPSLTLNGKSIEGGTGADGVSVTHHWDGTVLTVTSASGTSSADLQGPQGEKGEAGATGPQGPAGSDATVTAESIRSALGYTPANINAIFAEGEQPLFTNLFDTVAVEYGKVLNADGTVSATTAALAITDYIPVSVGDVIRMQDFSIYVGSASPRVVLYDASYARIIHVNHDAITEGAYYVEVLESDADGNHSTIRVNKPSSVAYIRICTHTSVIGKAPILTVNEEITYGMGYGSKLNEAVKVDYSQITNAPKKNCWSILPCEHINIAYSSIGRKPINTVAHFRDAAENYGYNALKCDVRPTSDGELVCCHDAGFTFDSSGYITAYDSTNATMIHDVTAQDCLGYSFSTGEHPCLVGDYLDVCREYGKVAFITIRNEYMDVVIPKLLEELKIHSMTYSAIINCMTYESLVTWRSYDTGVMLNYTLNFGVEIDSTYIDRAVSLGYCSLCGFSLSSASTTPSAACDFAYARENGIRLLQAIAYAEGSPEACYALGYDGCQIGYAWEPITVSVDAYTKDETETLIENAIGAAIGGSY